jgi:quinol monooxygenase YgiN
MQEEIKVIVRLKAKPDCTEQLKDSIIEVLTQAQFEPGYISCQLDVDLDDPTHFLLYERWQTLDDLLTYNSQPYHRTFERTAPELCVEPGNLPPYASKMQAARFREIHP